MSTNKHAAIRYKALDRCFSNRGRRYYIEDLVEVCNEAIYEYTGVAEGVKKRQVQEDIRFMNKEGLYPWKDAGMDIGFITGTRTLIFR